MKTASMLPNTCPDDPFLLRRTRCRAAGCACLALLAACNAAGPAPPCTTPAMQALAAREAVTQMLIYSGQLDPYDDGRDADVLPTEDGDTIRFTRAPTHTVLQGAGLAAMVMLDSVRMVERTPDHSAWTCEARMMVADLRPHSPRWPVVPLRYTSWVDEGRATVSMNLDPSYKIPDWEDRSLAPHEVPGS